MTRVQFPEWRGEVVQAVLAIADREAQQKSWRSARPVGGLDPLLWVYEVLLESGIAEEPFNDAVVVDANGEVEQMRMLCAALFGLSLPR